MVMVDKEARLYVGVGSKHGVSSEGLTQKVVDTCGINASEIHRVAVRGSYAFVDVPEAIADQVIEKLGASEVEGTGKNYFVKKAVTLSIPREGAPSDEGSAAHDDGHGSDNDSNESDNQDPRGSDDSHESHDHDGPTLLAVDEG